MTEQGNGHTRRRALTRVKVASRTLRWLPGYVWQRIARGPSAREAAHVMVAVADHFEPSFLPDAPTRHAEPSEQRRRVERWCREYPRAMESLRDSDGRPFRHTYFYPAEQCETELLDLLARHCHDGWGELEVHLHHGVDEPDTPDALRLVLRQFVAELATRGCLSRWEGQGMPRYAFVHGNWALANSAGGRYCGVDEEMQLLADTGCYADMTLPSAPDAAQVAKINALYECTLPLGKRAPHRRGRDLQVGRAPQRFPMIVQGPLAVRFAHPDGLLVPRIENGELTAAHPPTMERFRIWRRAGIGVRGRPEWVFIKLHCHGMDPRDEEALRGEPMRRFLSDLLAGQHAGRYSVHFVTAREMVNMALAACDGHDGNPGKYREYRLRTSRATAVP